MAITRIRGNTQIKQGTVDSTTVKDRSLITDDFAVIPTVPTAMTTAERDAIVNPATGLMIFNTDTKWLEFFDGTTWMAFVSTESVLDGGGAGATAVQIIDGGNA